MSLRTVAVSLRENVGSIDRDELERRLLTEPGIDEVFFRDSEPHRLFVAYDPTVLNDSLLLTRLYRQGVHPEPVSPRLTAPPPPARVPELGSASLWSPP